MPLLTIARLTLFEASRRRLLLAVLVLTIAVIAATGWGFSKLNTLTDQGQPAPHAEILLTAAALVIMMAYMFSTVLAVGAAFLAAPAIASDVESGIVLALLPRPLRRADFVLGKWLGLALLLGLYAVVAGALELLMVRAIVGYAPPRPFEALLFLAAQAIVLMTLALLGSTSLAPMTGGIIAVVLFGVVWISGIVTTIASAFDNTGLTTAGTVISLLLPTDGMWRGAVYNLEPAGVAAFLGTGPGRSTPFTASAPPTLPYLIWTAGWVVVMLTLAVRRFTRKDL